MERGSTTVYCARVFVHSDTRTLSGQETRVSKEYTSTSTVHKLQYTKRRARVTHSLYTRARKTIKQSRLELYSMRVVMQLLV